MIKNLLLYAKTNPATAPLYNSAKERYFALINRGQSRMNVLQAFPLYRPYSGGSYKNRAPLVLQSINDMVPALKAFGARIGMSEVPILKDTAYAERNGPGKVEALAALLKDHGSDKADLHDYHRVYASILGQIGEDRKVQLLEIGLGTNNTDVVSNMGIAGRPGASLRAFRDFLPQGHIYGADIDRRILFSEDRIDTYFIDQTERASFVALDKELPGEFHLMIDDGLHSPNANLNSLAFFLTRLAVGGFAVVEDIPRNALELWQFVGGLIPDTYDATIVESGPSLMFVVKRVS